MLWASYQRAEVTRQWAPVPCQVLSSQVLQKRATPSSPTKVQPSIRYEYTYQGTGYVGNQLRRVDGPTGDVDKAERIRQRYTPGQVLTCWVNPASPTQAVLEHESRAALYTLWFPLLFFFGGLKMAWDAVRRIK
jgi:hypothetical protein